MAPKPRELDPSNQSSSLTDCTTSDLGPLPDWLPQAVAAIDELLELEAGWDSYNAKAIDPLTAQSALRLLRQPCFTKLPAPIVAPTNKGGIQFEWSVNDFDLEIECVNPHEFQVLSVSPDDQAEEFNASWTDFDEISRVIRDVCS